MAQRSSVQPHARAKAEAGHSWRPAFMPRSAAMTGIHTVSNPASRLLIPVMQVMEKIMATVRLVEGLLVRKVPLLLLVTEREGLAV